LPWTAIAAVLCLYVANKFAPARFANLVAAPNRYVVPVVLIQTALDEFRSLSTPGHRYLCPLLSVSSSRHLASRLMANPRDCFDFAVIINLQSLLNQLRALG
jgi:hypothetical protein